MHYIYKNNMSVNRFNMGCERIGLSLIFYLCIFSLISSCTFTHKPKIVGNSLTLSTHVYDVEESGYPDVLYRFNGKYPANWPEKITIPQGSYIVSKTSGYWAPHITADQGAILAQQGTALVTYKIFGVCPGSKDGVFAHFDQQSQQLGLNVKKTPELDNDRWSSKSTMWTDCTGTALDSYNLIVKKDIYLDGYVMFDLRIAMREVRTTIDTPARPKSKSH